MKATNSILGVEDAERLLGIVMEGHHIVEDLRSKTAPTWIAREFGSRLSNGLSRIGAGRNRFVEESATEAYDEYVDPLRPHSASDGEWWVRRGPQDS